MTSREFNRLLFDRPAEAWTEGFPIGSGRLGAVVYGRPENERIQLNEDSLWFGGPRDRHNPDAKTHLPEIRELIFKGRIKEAEELAVLALSGLPESQRHYVPLGNLLLQFSMPDGQMESYSRALDLDKGVVRITFRQGGVTFTREVFASFPDQAIVVRLSADRPGAVSCSARLERGNWRYSDRAGRAGNDAIFMAGNSGGEGGCDYAAVLKASAEDGSTKVIGEHIVVENATAVTLLLAAATTFRVKNPLEDAEKRTKEAAAHSYDALYKRHVGDHSELFQRVSLVVDPENSSLDNMTLDHN